MARHLLDGISAYWRRVTRRHRAKGPIILDRRRIYVLPTRSGLLFGVVLMAMLLGAINYNNSLVYALTFLLSSLTIVSILHTFRNLHKLIFRAGHPHEVFAGDTVRFPFAIENQHLDRFGVALHFDDGEPAIVDLNRGDMHWVHLSLPASHRGWLTLPRVTVSTLFPLGLFRAWSYLYFDMHLLVYPRPAPDQPLPFLDGVTDAMGGDLVPGADDFSQLRPYQPGDSLHHVHWKAYAREMGLVVKQFGTHRAHECWLTWESATEHDIEARISQLCRWVLNADAEGITYGLLIPGHRIKPAHGERHRHQCLEILALHGQEDKRNE